MTTMLLRKLAVLDFSLKTEASEQNGGTRIGWEQKLTEIILPQKCYVQKIVHDFSVLKLRRSNIE